MKIQINPSHFKELIKRGYSLDSIYLLELINEDSDISSLYESSKKIKTLYTEIIRKGLISDKEDKLTTIGNELLNFLNTEGEAKIVKHKPSVTEFEEWWQAFPGTDTFTYKGKRFIGSRGLRRDKSDCQVKFEKILIEGDYTARELIDGLIYDVNQKKESSYKTGTNKLSYMQNSATYLNQRSYEPFIELAKEHPVKEIVGTTDI